MQNLSYHRISKKIKMLVTVVELHHKFLKQRWCCWNCLSTFPSVIGKGLKTDEEWGYLSYLIGKKTEKKKKNRFFSLCMNLWVYICRIAFCKEVPLMGCMRGNLVGPMWMHANHGRIVLWKGFIMDMILEQNHVNHVSQLMIQQP